MFKERVTKRNKVDIAARYITLPAVIIISFSASGCSTLKEDSPHQVNQQDLPSPSYQPEKKTPVTSHSRKISWIDHANNEDGYIVEWKDKGNYVAVAKLAANSTFYEDVSPISKGLNCYRVGAYNQAGTAYSKDFCITMLSGSPSRQDTRQRKRKTAAVALNHAKIDTIAAPGSATLIEVDQRSNSSIDVTATEYITSTGTIANTSYHDGRISTISYSGNAKFRDGGYEFIDNDNVVASGYTGMPWNEQSGVTVNLRSAAEEQSVASLYFKAGAWANGVNEIELMINGERALVELTKGYTWFYVRADIAFQGYLNVAIKPVGQVGGYSHLFFAGLTLSE